MRARHADFAPDGKVHKVTPDILDILEVVEQLPCVPFPFIAKLLGYKPTIQTYSKGGEEKEAVRYVALSTKLSRARHDLGLLACPLHNDDMYVFGIPHSYTLTDRGEGELDEESRLVGYPKTGVNSWEQLASSSILASLMLGAKEHGLTFIDHSEFAARSSYPTKDVLSVPVVYDCKARDGKVYTFKGNAHHDSRPVAIQNPQGPRTWFLGGIEIDLDSSGRIVTSHKKATTSRHLYEAIALLDEYHKKHFGFPKTSIIFAFTSRKRMEGVMEDFADMTKGKGHERVLFTTIPKIRKEPFAYDGSYLTRDYLRVGHPSFNILSALGLQ